MTQATYLVKKHEISAAPYTHQMKPFKFISINNIESSTFASIARIAEQILIFKEGTLAASQQSTTAACLNN